MIRIAVFLVSLALALPAFAHVSEQGFVLLLPTDLYIAGGVASVAATVLILMALPPEIVKGFLAPGRLWPRVPARAGLATSMLSALLLLWLVWVGLAGSTDPLKNPLPLGIWTLWWIGLVAVQGVFGDLWRWINPFTGPATVLRRLVPRPPLRLRDGLGVWPGLGLFLVFMAFLLADPAPTDPSRLAGIVGTYWSLTLLAVLLFGRRWLVTGEFATILMRAFASVGLFGRLRRRTAIGLPGWQVLRKGPVSLSLAVFILCLLGSGSFDGLNETFWWLSVLGINPLAFPGRSAIVNETIAGLLIFNAGLVIAFWLAIWMGEVLAQGQGVTRAVRTFAPSILPIAVGYHIGHYLPTFLVDSQYALAAASDPLARGDDLLGLGTFYVTNGFFNTQATVKVIWLSQAGAVVIGHVLAILLAHGLALRLYQDPKRALLSQLPLAIFMVAYTFFGLWLLASPRGA